MVFPAPEGKSPRGGGRGELDVVGTIRLTQNASDYELADVSSVVPFVVPF